MNQKMREELLQEVREDKRQCLKKQFSRSPYYILLRTFGADWWWSIKELTKMEKNLIRKGK